MQKDRDLESFSAVCLDAHKHMCLVALSLSHIVDLVGGEICGENTVSNKGQLISLRISCLHREKYRTVVKLSTKMHFHW